MKSTQLQIIGGIAGALVCIALLLSTFELHASIRARLDAANSFCGTRVGQLQDAVWLSFMATMTLGLTGAALAFRSSFYPKVCQLAVIAAFLISVASLILIGNH